MRIVTTSMLACLLLFGTHQLAYAQGEQDGGEAPIEDVMTGRFGAGFNINLGGNSALMARYWMNDLFSITGNFGLLITADPSPVDLNAGLFLGFGVNYNLVYEPGEFYFGIGGHLDLGILGVPGTTLVEVSLSAPFTLEYFIHRQVSFTLQAGLAMRFGDPGVLLNPLFAGTGSDFAMFLGNRGDVLGLAGFTVYFD